MLVALEDPDSRGICSLYSLLPCLCSLWCKCKLFQFNRNFVLPIKLCGKNYRVAKSPNFIILHIHHHLLHLIPIFLLSSFLLFLSCPTLSKSLCFPPRLGLFLVYTLTVLTLSSPVSLSICSLSMYFPIVLNSLESSSLSFLPTFYLAILPLSAFAYHLRVL